MKTIIFSTLFIFYSFWGFCQNTSKDIIHLKSGEQYQGYIIEQQPGQSLSLLQIPQRDTLVFLYADVEKITKEVQVTPPKEELENPSKDQNQNPKAFTNIEKERLIQIHYGLGGGDFEFRSLGITFSQQLNEKVYAGFGVYYIIDNNNRGFPVGYQNIYPLGIDVKYKFSESSNQKFSTYLVFNGGIYFPARNRFDWEPELEVQTQNKFYFNPSVAFKFEPFDGYGLMFDIGYQYISADYVSTASNELIAQKRNNNISLRGTLYF